MKYRTKLTDAEYNAFLHYTSAINIDDELDIETKNDKVDWWIDRSTNKHISLRQGLQELWDAVAYPLVHDAYNKEAELMAKVFYEFGIITMEQMAWCMMPEEE